MAIFGNLSSGILTITGDSLDNGITVGRDAAGILGANGGTISILGGPATIANTSLIRVFGMGGNDTVTLNEASGALPKAQLFGGDGNDILTAGFGNDQLFGQTGADTLLGKGGFDVLSGGSGNDTLVGGDGDDQMFGQGGDDRMIWNSGDDSDVMDGGGGNDTAEINGGNGAEEFAFTANGTHVRFDRLTPAPFSLDVSATENMVLNAFGGDDKVFATGNLGALTKLTIDGGTGNDIILAGNGNDVLLGGDGNDLIDGNQGNDVAFLGAGNDVFTWDPGDGSDVIEGQDGIDKLAFNGSSITENINISANGSRVLFTRDIAAITMDMNSVEQISFNAFGGTDNINVRDMSGTGVQNVAINLAGVVGGTTGDGAVDTVTIDGTSGDDIISFSVSNGVISVLGLPETVTITAFEAGDRIVINGLDGSDVIDASGLAGMQLFINGGNGDDVLTGSAGSDVISGGDGDDVMIGGGGLDVFDGGLGDNLIL